MDYDGHEDGDQGLLRLLQTYRQTLNILEIKYGTPETKACICKKPGSHIASHSSQRISHSGQRPFVGFQMLYGRFEMLSDSQAPGFFASVTKACIPCICIDNVH